MRARTKTLGIVAHHSLSKDVDVKTITQWHIERDFTTIGYHYVIRFDGTIEVGRALHLQGAHAVGRNNTHIGVCLTGDFSKHKPTEAQYIALAQLQEALSMAYGKTLPIEYHHEKCPGKHYDRTYIDDLRNSKIRKQG